MGSDSSAKSEKKRDIFWIAGVVILFFLFIYLPYDHGGFYPRSYALAAILAFPFLALKIIFPTGERYDKGIVVSTYIFFIFLLLSTYFSTDRHNSFLQLIYYFLCAAGFILGYHAIKYKKIFRSVVYFLMANLLLVCFFGILYYVIQTKPSARAFGRFYQANILGGFLIMFIPMALMAAFVVKKWLLASLYILLTAISITILFYTFSLASFISLFLAIPIIFFFARKYASPGKIALKTLIILILLSLFIFALSPGLRDISNRAGNKSQIKDVKENSNNINKPSSYTDTDSGYRKKFKKKIYKSGVCRLDFYNAAVRIALENPVVGVGLGNFQYHYPRYQKRVEFFAKYPHNFYLSLVSQAGIPALIAFLVLILFLARRIKRNISTMDEEDNDFIKPVAIAMSVGLIASLLHIFFDVDFTFLSIAFIFWTIAGVLAGIGQKKPELPDRTPGRRILRLIAALFITLLIFPPFFHYLSFDMQGRGRAAQQKLRNNLAGECFEKAIKLDPFDNEAYRIYAYFLCKTGKPDRALPLVDKAIKLSPRRARLRETRGVILDALKRPKEANKSYLTSISLDPINQIYSYIGLGRNYEKAGDKAAAMDMYRKVISYYENIDYTDLWYFRTTRLKPQVSLAYYSVGNLYIERKEYGKAVQAFHKSLEHEELSPAMFGLGYAYLGMGEYQKAIVAFLRFSEKRKDIAISHYYISECYKKLGDNENTAKHMDIYRELSKGK
ncbi:MAG: O-antigen ligase family protein [Candidatus Eremiobacteraeota bacterium]|nr:O-antigen ligase family protein [Candidatus Eremiobacteraeota bacterium]